MRAWIISAAVIIGTAIRPEWMQSGTVSSGMQFFILTIFIVGLGLDSYEMLNRKR